MLVVLVVYLVQFLIFNMENSLKIGEWVILDEVLVSMTYYHKYPMRIVVMINGGIIVVDVLELMKIKNPPQEILSWISSPKVYYEIFIKTDKYRKEKLKKIINGKKV